MNININNLWVRFVGVFLIIGILSFFFLEKKDKNPILIGFAAQLTGNQAELGVQERNGAQIAVENINELGGIAGHKVELIVRDDCGIAKKAKSVDRELIKSGVLAIIGHATSEQTLSGFEVTNPAKVVLIGPTVSTPVLSNLDDYFFRVYPSFKESAQMFAQYIYKINDIKRIAIIYDKDNAAYSKSYSTNFADKFRLLNGNIVGEFKFSSEEQKDFSPLLTKLRDAKAEGLLIIASDMDTALIAQRIRLMGWKTQLFTTSWSQTETLINNGGKAVEGIKFEQAYALTSKSNAFINFKSRYKDRFGNAPTFGAVLSYEATMALAEALKNTRGKAKGLREELIKINDLPGLIGNLSFDEFGDVERPFYLGTIRNGKFIILNELTSRNFGGE